MAARDNYSVKTAEDPAVQAEAAALVEEAALAAVPVVVATEEFSEGADGWAARL